MDTEPVGDPAVDIDIGQIMKMIPHRYPFLMIDRLIEAVPEVSATAIKNVSINEPYFMGHFPGHPVMPGVLIIEAMAQTAAVLAVHSLGSQAEGKLVYFTSVESARFRRPIVPGDQVRVEVKKQHRRGNMWRFRGEAKVEDRLMAEAVYAAMIMDA